MRPLEPEKAGNAPSLEPPGGAGPCNTLILLSGARGDLLTSGTGTANSCCFELQRGCLCSVSGALLNTWHGLETSLFRTCQTSTQAKGDAPADP